MVYIFGSKKKKPDNHIESPGRRKTLENIVKGIIFVGGTAYTWRCKGNTTGPEVPEPPVPVTLNFDIYNHMTGYIKNHSTINAMSGDPFTIRMSDLGVSGVDEQRLALYTEGFRSNQGFSNTGELTLTAPKQSTNYHIVLFNMIPRLNYNWMDSPINSKLYKNKRDYVVYRKDYDGQPKKWNYNFDQEKPWRVAFNQHNQALDRGWIKWGSFTRKPAPNDEQGDFSYGYGYCYGHMGIHAGSRVLVDADILTVYGAFLLVANEEIFENATCEDDIGGGAGSWEKMVDNTTGNLNNVGEHLLAYAFAKDGAPISNK